MTEMAGWLCSEISIVNQIGSMFHINTISKQPKFSFAHLIIIEMGSGDVHGCVEIGVIIISIKHSIELDYWIKIKSYYT